MVEPHLHTNRLIHEKSPYLLQHAHNPVDWYPWSEEAFKESRLLDKPIFLSIGYATCHWCHTMEKESFENLEVAKLMNATFINIKVDREEMPEVDSLYMEFAQSMMAGSAGWPLNVILTPNLEPFFAATYLPPKTSHGLMGLLDLVERIGEVWASEERERIEEQATKIVEVFSKSVHSKGAELPKKEQILDAAELFFKLADPIYGGLKGIPKFPVGYQYSFLSRYCSSLKDTRALFLVERTLDMMQRGGIYDHLGGGFSRYSVDEKWLIPHFEKMLYDNALLAEAYQEAWLLTKRPLFREVASDVLDYILRDMTHREGGFFSAEDADSEGHEGLFYTWDYNEVVSILGKTSSKHFLDYYGMTKEGNFEGRNVLHISQRLDEFSQKLKLDPQKIEDELLQQKKTLFKVREKRIHPFKDDKILSSWNGLMIHSLAVSSAAFQDEKYLRAALKAATFIKDNLWEEGLLLRRWRENQGLYSAGLDEYAFLIRGLITLFEVGAGGEWLEWAIQMTQIVEDLFKIKEGAFYQTDGKDPNIILRKCSYSDGAEPSGNAVHTENLLRLYQLTGQKDYLTQAEDVMMAVKKFIDNYPPGYSFHVMNINRYYHLGPTLVIALNENKEYFHELHKAIFEHYCPHKAVIFKESSDQKLKQLIEVPQEPIQGKTTLYICYEGVCKQPLTDIEEMQKTLLEL